MSEIITISGSTAKLSGSEQVLKYFGTLLNDKQLSVTHISVKDLPYQDLFEMNVKNPKIKQIIALIQNARGVLIGSPVYKGGIFWGLKSID